MSAILFTAYHLMSNAKQIPIISLNIAFFCLMQNSNEITKNSNLKILLLIFLYNWLYTGVYLLGIYFKQYFIIEKGFDKLDSLIKCKIFYSYFLSKNRKIQEFI